MFQLVCKAVRCTHHNGGSWNNCRRSEEQDKRDFDIIKMDENGRCKYFVREASVTPHNNGADRVADNRTLSSRLLPD
jgi:hypothetical protein